eukprot:GEMP01043502.1.p1 GENE.GEMP01043502.1~~GEMP01043502.1.p1  ORF type:complete len:303 (+),score=80.04 GEMP01043502.1:95-1003(+)
MGRKPAVETKSQKTKKPPSMKESQKTKADKQCKSVTQSPSEDKKSRKTKQPPPLMEPRKTKAGKRHMTTTQSPSEDEVPSRSVLSAVAEDLMQPNGSSVVSNDVCGGHIQGALREEKWLQELEAEQRRKREELHQQKQEEERQRELHLEQQRNAALARASDAPRVPGSSAPPVINVPEVAAFSAMSTADKDKEKEKERETKARQCLQSMKKLPADQLQAAMKTLHAYISNLAKNPMDEKFHRINMENKNFASTVAPHEDAIALLMLCGFQKEGVFLVMDQAFIKSKGSFLWSVLSKVDVLRR